MSSKARIGLGILTFNRPKFFREAMKGVVEHVLDMVDTCWVYNDGSTKRYHYGWLPERVKVHHASENKGIAKSKNWLLRQLMAEGCDFIFLMEDDVKPVSKLAISGYLAAYKMTGVPHFMFAHHGPNLHAEALASQGPLEAWPNACGAYCFYVRNVVEQAGYFDENFKNALEHIEHSWRIFKGYFDYGLWPDVVGSSEWIKEIPGAIEKSTLRRNNKQFIDNLDHSFRYWAKKDPDGPAAAKLLEIQIHGKERALKNA